MPRLIAVLTLIATLVPLSAAWSQTTGGAAAPPSPAVEAPPASPPANPPAVVVPAAPAAAPIVKKKPRLVHPAKAAEFEPASGRLKVTTDTYVYAEPSRVSRKLEKAEASKFVNVTGVTRYYVRVKLKDGRIGFVPNSAVELVKPFHKDFLLAADSPVYAEPNRFSKRVAEVHKGRNVHVTGIAPSYIRIKMKSGIQGFVPQSAVE